MSLRTLIEICLPYQIAPMVSDYLIWGAPLVVGLLLLIALKDFIRHNLLVSIAIGVVVYFACIYSKANTQYKDSWDNLYLGDPIWANLINLGAYNTNQAEVGQISWEECYYRRSKLQEGVDLVVEDAMPASAFNNARDQFMETWRNRDERLRTYKAGLEGGTLSHWSYRIAIDKMDMEPGPFQGYLESRDHEQQGWRNVVLVPFFCLAAVLAILGFLKKPMFLVHTGWTKFSGTRKFGKLLAPFTHAQSLDEVGFVKGPLKLAYPTLFVGNVPIDLARAWIHPDEPRVLHVDSTGTRLFLYQDDSQPASSRPHVDPAPVRPKFFFHEGPAAPPKPSKPAFNTSKKSIFTDQ